METWKRVIGYESLYVVSSCGRVRSFHKHGRGKNGKLMKPWTSPQGYTMTTLSKDGCTFAATVSRLVLAAFKGPAPEDKPYACHKDNNPANSHKDNLYWGSNADNQADRIPNGTTNRGSRNGKAVLTESDIPNIKRRLALGESQISIATNFNVVPSVVSNIKRGKRWGHVI